MKRQLRAIFFSYIFNQEFHQFLSSLKTSLWNSFFFLNFSMLIYGCYIPTEPVR
jgi:hypothetical protein